MNIHDLSKPEQLEKWSFIWSEARLVIAAVALLIGGIPVLSALLPLPALFGLIRLVLTLSWIISGLASIYLAYRWYTGGRKLFGKQDIKDTTAFFISIITGVNLGLTGIFGNNPGMSLMSGPGIFRITALVYLIVAVYLYWRWKQSGQRIVS